MSAPVIRAQITNRRQVGGSPAIFEYPATEARETSQSVVGPPGRVWLTAVGYPRIVTPADRPVAAMVSARARGLASRACRTVALPASDVVEAAVDR